MNKVYPSSWSGASSGVAAGRSGGLGLWRGRLDQWAKAMRPEVPRAPLRWTKPEPHTGPGVRFCQWAGYTHPRCGLSATPGTRRNAPSASEPGTIHLPVRPHLCPSHSPLGFVTGATRTSSALTNAAVLTHTFRSTCPPPSQSVSCGMATLRLNHTPDP